MAKDEPKKNNQSATAPATALNEDIPVMRKSRKAASKPRSKNVTK